ncbi:MAG: alpha/beta fold hydrolase [Prevotella sp.]|nr:alpha/beta fold hydrolase [Prevotella sp.]
MKKILFLHGFFASSRCVPALALREAFEGRAEVITPDLPTYPRMALEQIREICDKEMPDLLVGNSCGSFYAQMVAPVVGVPALLGNPHFRMTEFLKQRIGEHEYKSPRKDGNQKFVIDEALIQEFAELEAIQFQPQTEFRDRVWGLFGEQDTLAHFEPLFLEHYNQSFHFPGGHTPTADEVRTWYVPLIEKMLAAFVPRLK